MPSGGSENGRCRKPGFRESAVPEAWFPRRSPLGSSVNRGKRKGRSPGTYLGLPATVEATRVAASSSVICSTNFLVRKESSSYLSLLLLLWPLFLWEQDVVDRYVHLRDPKAGQVLHPVYHVVAHGLGGRRDLPTVINGHREIGGSLLRPTLHGHAACLAPATDAGHGDRHSV